MKKTLYTLLLFISFVSFSQENSEKFHRAKIHYNSAENLKQLQSMGVPMDHGNHKPGYFLISDFSDTEIQTARNLGLQVDVEIEDVQKFYVEQNLNTKSYSNTKNNSCVTGGNINYITPVNYNNGSMGGYLTYAEMLQELDDMHALYPNLISGRSNVGTFQTEEGRALQWTKITNNPQSSNNRPQVLYTAIHHAREPASLSQTIFFMWYLLENYNTSDEIKNIVDNTELYFIPVVNPDGYIRNETTNPNGGGMWRKNRRNHGNGTFGVDNNRNYDYWINGDPNQSVWNTTGTSQNTNGETYAGSSPFSEPENQAVKFFVDNHNFTVALNAHTSGELLLYPFGYANNVPTPDDTTYRGISEIMVSQSGYANIISAELYPAAGDSDDFMYGQTQDHNKIFAFTPEIGPQFWPPESAIIGICKEMMFTNITAAKLTSNYAAITDTTPEFIGGAANFNATFALTKYGLSSVGNFTVSINPISTNIASVGAAQNFNNLAVLQNVSGSIPIGLEVGTTSGDDIVYELVVFNGSYEDRTLITKKFGNLLTIFEDNGNSVTTNFTNNGWGITTQTFVSPSSSITDSPSGNYGANQNKTITLNSPIDLAAATGATISFYAKWDIENNWDYAQFEISINNGSTWIPQCGKFTNPGSTNNGQPTGEPLYDGTQTEWVLEEINLSDYLGESILARFQFVTDNNVQADGFYFDDLKVNLLENTVLSVADLSKLPFAIYPNPVTDVLNIQTNINNYDLQLYTLQGQLIFEQKNNNGTQNINYSNFSSGMYFLVLHTENGSETLKFIKK
ncbi:MAG: T9SS type A sorting domain-containing protein [Flavobacteriia bacterium]|nr:T9SS type A sorting domain-containing protein [Flavobacteriia bacterium]